VHANGKDLINAVAVGYEVQLRIGPAVVWKKPIVQRSHPVTGSPWQVFGSVTSASKLLGLDREQIAMAMGVAGSAAPIPSDMKCSLNPASKEEGTSMVKNNYGYMSETGVRAALMSKKGYTGPTDLLEGETGFWRMIGSDNCDFEAMTAELGENYRLLNIEFKPYSCCRLQHPLIDAALKAVSENKVNVQDIDRIVLRTSRSQVTPPKDDYEPKTATSIINSTPYSVAIALTGLKPGPSWFTKETLNSVNIRTLAKKILLVADQPESNVWRGEYYATAEISSKGKTYVASVNHPKGTVRNPMSEEEQINKFKGMAQTVLGSERTEELVHEIRNLEKVKDVIEITDLLRPARM
jgi:2-methylcitrate dehydratase PrpD